MPGKLADGEHVSRAPREAHDVSTACVSAESPLQPRHRPQREEDLLGTQRQVAAGSDLPQRILVHRRVLTHLQLRKVKPERLSLPDEVLELAEREPGRAGLRERPLHDPQVAQEPLDAPIPPFAAGPGRDQSVSGQAHLPAVG